MRQRADARSVLPTKHHNPDVDVADSRSASTPSIPASFPLTPTWPTRGVVARSAASLALVMLGVTSCSADVPDDSAIEVADADSAIDVDDVLGDAVVGIRSTGCPPTFGLGTATVIDDGLLITAAHTVAGRTNIEVLHPGKLAGAARLVWFDPDLDVAVLATDTRDITPIPLSTSEAEAGDRAVIGVSDGRVARVDAVSVRRHVNIETTDVWRDRDVTRPGFELDAAVEPGDSGALVVIDGQGVGIVWSRSTTATGRAWAVDVPPELADPAFRATLTEPADSLRCP